MAETGAPSAWENDSSKDRPPDPAPFRLLQLTDLHLFAEPSQQLLGQDTRCTLETVLALAAARHWPPDAIVLTGDLVHDCDAAGYRFLRERFDGLGVPYHSIPGNHDCLDLLVGHLDAAAASALRLIRAGAWDLLLLDSTVPGSEGGHINEHVLAGLAAHRLTGDGRPTLVFVHHHLLPVGSRWIDTMTVDNGTEVLAELARNEHIRAVICGHIHQSIDQHVNGVRLLATPSTCIQFLPGSADFALDARRPGYRWLELYPDGRLETGVERTDAYPHPLSFVTGGY